MRNVTRPASPAKLSTNSTAWTEELLKSLKDVDTKNQQRKKGDRKHKVSSTIWNRYNEKGVKEKLLEMYGKAYGGLCCYCEQRVGHVAHEHIEHRHPKAVFPTLTFDWDNLHLACPACNIAKGDKWDTTYPILDAAVDKDINNEHLTYKITRMTISRIGLSDRGDTTISHANLDRPELADLSSNGTRHQVINGVFDTVARVRKAEKSNPHSTRVANAKNLLEKLYEGELGSLVEYYAGSML